MFIPRAAATSMNPTAWSRELVLIFKFKNIQLEIKATV